MPAAKKISPALMTTDSVHDALSREPAPMSQPVKTSRPPAGIVVEVDGGTVRATHNAESRIHDLGQVERMAADLANHIRHELRCQSRTPDGTVVVTVEHRAA